MTTTYQRHLAAINAGRIEKTNIIGLRKIFNALARKDAGLSVGRMSPKISDGEAAALMDAIIAKLPRVVGPLHDSGLKVLRSPRYAKRLRNVAGIIATLDHFELAGFDQLGRYGGNTPLYRAVSRSGGSFTFRNVAWQSGGNGPEVI